jgi:hypothetical protein
MRSEQEEIVFLINIFTQLSHLPDHNADMLEQIIDSLKYRLTLTRNEKVGVLNGKLSCN